VSAAPAGAVTRSGPGYWLDSYRVMVRWQFAYLRMYLPVMAAVEILAGVGFVLGFGLFFPGRVPPPAAMYIATGIPVINLYLLGLILLPQIVGQQKTAGTYDFVQSLPVPRPVGFAAWYAMTLLIGLPGMAATLLVAGLRFDVHFAVSAAVVPATVLVSLTATAIGFALGHGVPQPMVTQVLTQVLNFFVIGFAPVCFPPSQLPSWLAALNRVLPFESMAVVMRGALLGAPVGGVPHAYLLLSAWSCGCLLIAAWAVGRRG
jgi:ABC-2 type transport system permease protein